MSNDPRLLPVRQELYSAPIDDIPASVRAAVDVAVPSGRIQRGQRIALTAGSCGLNNIALILKTAAECLRERGAQPFIVPAMGSHAGATGEGQARLLREAFGITEEAMSCLVAQVGNDDREDVLLDRLADERVGIRNIIRDIIRDKETR